jgi:hypothetical protein
MHGLPLDVAARYRAAMLCARLQAVNAQLPVAAIIILK